MRYKSDNSNRNLPQRKMSASDETLCPKVPVRYPLGGIVCITMTQPIRYFTSQGDSLYHNDRTNPFSCQSRSVPGGEVSPAYSKAGDYIHKCQKNLVSLFVLLFLSFPFCPVSCSFCVSFSRAFLFLSIPQKYTVMTAVY